MYKSPSVSEGISSRFERFKRTISRKKIVAAITSAALATGLTGCTTPETGNIKPIPREIQADKPEQEAKRDSVEQLSIKNAKMIQQLSMKNSAAILNNTNKVREENIINRSVEGLGTTGNSNIYGYSQRGGGSSKDDEYYIFASKNAETLNNVFGVNIILYQGDEREGIITSFDVPSDAGADQIFSDIAAKGFDQKRAEELSEVITQYASSSRAPLFTDFMRARQYPLANGNYQLSDLFSYKLDPNNQFPSIDTFGKEFSPLEGGPVMSEKNLGIAHDEIYRILS